MNRELVRAWWSYKQGLDGRLKGKTPEAVLETVGWARSVGGANPYLTLFARSGCGREEAENAREKGLICELPSARGCTYFLPASDYAIGLTCGQGYSDEAAMKTARNYLGVTDKEILDLQKAVLKALKKGPLNPRDLKTAVGDAARNLGEEGKKRGQTTTLPLALGFLQSSGRIVRIPNQGRLDTQTFSYALWEPSPLAGSKMSKEQAYKVLAEKFFGWIGPARVKDWQWFSGLGVKASQEAIESLELVDIGDDYRILKREEKEFSKFVIPKESHFVLVSSLDGILHLRRDVLGLLKEEDMEKQMPDGKTMHLVGHLMDLSCNAILDRGRLVGLWEFDPSEGGVVYKCWVKETSQLKEAIAKTERFIRDELGDARSFSLDSPESRKPKIKALRS